MAGVQAPGLWPKLRQLSFIWCGGKQDAVAAVKNLQDAGFWLRLGDIGVEATMGGVEELSAGSLPDSDGWSGSEGEEVDSFLHEDASDVTWDQSGNEGEGGKEDLSSEWEVADGELEMEVQQLIAEAEATDAVLLESQMEDASQETSQDEFAADQAGEEEEA